MRIVKDRNLYEEDLKEVQRFVDGIDWTAFHEHLKELGFDTELEVVLSTDGGRCRLHIRGKDNLAAKTGIMAPCFKWVRLTDFGSFLSQRVDYDENLYNAAIENQEFDKTWADFDAKFGPITLDVNIHLRFEQKNGGRNGLDLFCANYTEETGWKFN